MDKLRPGDVKGSDTVSVAAECSCELPPLAVLWLPVRVVDFLWLRAAAEFDCADFVRDTLTDTPEVVVDRESGELEDTSAVALEEPCLETDDNVAFCA